MAHTVRIEMEAGVRMQTPTRGLLTYFEEIVHPDYIGYEWETQIRRAGRPQIVQAALLRASTAWTNLAGARP